jgi:hypothetical protein
MAAVLGFSSLGVHDYSFWSVDCSCDLALARRRDGRASRGVGHVTCRPGSADEREGHREREDVDHSQHPHSVLVAHGERRGAGGAGV